MPGETATCREGCSSLKRCPLLPAQPHCTNSNARAAEGFWQRESLSSGDAEAAARPQAPHQPCCGTWETQWLSLLVCNTAFCPGDLNRVLSQIWGEARRSKTGAKIISPSSAVGPRISFYPPNALVLHRANGDTQRNRRR